MSTWQKKEFEAIHERRKKAFGSAYKENPDETPEDLVGLSLSGGGIRSALYNDGFLQGLSHRGFLRFVDYLSSVSGGGYIAGHLIAQADTNTEEGRRSAKDSKGFHDDEAASPDESPRWHLGRDPLTGKIDPRRLAGIGSYLTRPMELLPAYLLTCFFSATFYVGLVGVLATLAALFWRSFDDPVFRIIYMEILKLRFGNELLIAFIPAILFSLVYLICEISFSVTRWLIGTEKVRARQFHAKFRAWSLGIFILVVLVSLAIFLGNGTTNVQSNATSSLYLNHYAQWLAVIAGTIQILVFFGSDRLFRSEREDAKSWQKILQRTIAVGVSLFLVFAMVHWMGRENISHFVEGRDAKLRPADINDWHASEGVFADYGLRFHGKRSSDSGLPNVESLDPKDHMPSWLTPKDNWKSTLVGRRWQMFSGLDDGSGDFDTEAVAANNVKSEAEGGAAIAKTWMLEQRILGAFNGYIRAIFYPRPTDIKAASQHANLITPNSSETSTLPNAQTIDRAFNTVLYLELIQRQRLEEWNQWLAEPKFTLAMIGEELDLPVDPMKQKNLEWLLSELTSAKLDFSDQQLQEIITAVRNAANEPALVNNKPKQVLEEDLRKVNRLLLEATYPRALRRVDIPTTYLIPPFDQRARRSWLGFWMVIAAIGAAGGVFRHQVATVFRFYRSQLGANFLIHGKSRDTSLALTELSRLRPTADGLPYPLMLAASMEPVRVNGGYTIQSEPFLFTPNYCGDLQNCERRIRSEQLALDQDPDSKSITLGDAVTLSGAAVTAFMTTNRCLSVLVDFFNTGLGMQVYRTEKHGQSSGRSSNLGWLTVVIATVGFAGLMYWASAKDYGTTAVSGILALIVGSCLLYERGVPHFLRLLILPREIGPLADAIQNGNSPRKRHSARSFYIADGGFSDYLGITTLLERRCNLMVVSDAGANVGNDHLGTLARMCEQASAKMGIKFYDLDHEAPIDFGRLQFDEKRLVHQPYLCIRVRYPDRPDDALLIYCQMAICDSDPIEIQQIRNRFPTFPDEPTLNQFYTEDQVSAYRALGYHIATRMCRELERWRFSHGTTAQIDRNDPGNNGGASSPSGSPWNPVHPKADTHKTRSAKAYREFLHNLNNTSPCKETNNHFAILKERLLTPYRLACYEELTYRKDDIFREAIWPITANKFPNFRSRADEWFYRLLANSHDKVLPKALEHAPARFESVKQPEFASLAAERWLCVYESSADVRSAYRKAILEDINVMEREAESFCHGLWQSIAHPGEIGEIDSEVSFQLDVAILTSHLTVIAATSQEIHCGRPHSAFQIGGRRKLIDVCESISRSIVAAKQNSMSDEPDSALRDSIASITTELLELKRSVFQGREHVTTISVAQCCGVMWGRWCRGNLDAIDISEGLIGRSQKLFESSNSTSTESRMVESRKMLDRSLRRTDLKQLIDTLQRLWYLGYFHLDADQELNEASSAEVSFENYHDRIIALCKIKQAPKVASGLLDLWRSERGVRKLYRRAVNEDTTADSTGNGDITKSRLGHDSHVYHLWKALLAQTENATPAVVNRLRAAHLNVIICTYVSKQTSHPQVEFVTGGEAKLAKICLALSELFSLEPVEFGETKTDGKMEKALDQIESINQTVFTNWNDEYIVDVCHLILLLWTGTFRGNRDPKSLKLRFPLSEDSVLCGKITGQSDLSTFRSQISGQDRPGRVHLNVLLSQHWYSCLLTQQEAESCIENHKSSNAVKGNPQIVSE